MIYYEGKISVSSQFLTEFVESNLNVSVNLKSIDATVSSLENFLQKNLCIQIQIQSYLFQGRV